ncbi:MAG: DUF4159 domain-containing protein [Nitrospinaceae bacterium]|jgi:hypothetical protein|nr:DUF4159 domain-containing protein [Nitrospinaceae bacterium]MDP6657956.1 DUF4159 domain-containing protein [Nitrospinaceae bacterium]MDP6711139.1 DUF4159 domain-containing protein [Nitrospinaceae bacterium]MDP7057216.1 DUF4159 domain-containing protein [Nitrospinaceae bacterium]HAK38198.1 hypothetical protein [Nitrospina sp.]|tara:strand:- start:1872 stop:2633 length:762 start_codon:yes stop_codon:yes gene_type:complete
MRTLSNAIFIVSLLGSVIFPTASDADYSSLSIPQVKYQGGQPNPHPTAVSSLLGQVARRTSIEVNREPLQIKLSDPNLYRYPFIYLAGNEKFESFSQEELHRLRNYLSFGGFLLIDDNSAKANSKFDTSVREMINQLFPQIPLQKISRDHSIFRSFYLINRVTGRKQINPYMEGIKIKGRTVLIYSTNDFGGAWARDNLGQWSHDIIGGGSRQRQLTIRLGVNIIMYALTLDYKKDMVHLPIILERLRRSHSR